MKDRIAILLSAYNGEKYLSEQINSILAQSYKDWNLYIKDDGSTDSTLQIIEKYCTSCSNIHFLQDAKRRGACMSFIWLLENVESDYYLFCDQDDIWLTDKIQLSLKKMKEAEAVYPATPILVHTDLVVVDANLKELSPSFWKYSKLKQRYLSQFNYLGACNGVTGCTVMINDRAKKAVLPIHPKAPMHDYWFALKISQVGKIAALDLPTILYRQHANNDVGAKEVDVSYFAKKVKYLTQTIKSQLSAYAFLKDIGYGNIFKYYWHKIIYSILRSI